MEVHKIRKPPELDLMHKRQWESFIQLIPTLPQQGLGNISGSITFVLAGSRLRCAGRVSKLSSAQQGLNGGFFINIIFHVIIIQCKSAKMLDGEPTKQNGPLSFGDCSRFSTHIIHSFFFFFILGLRDRPVCIQKRPKSP